MNIKDIIEKIGKQIKGDWIDVWNYINKFGFEKLDLTEEEKEIVNQYLTKKVQ